ncbi:MAG TPA: lipopolysaccharide biosynthesis protein [Candidatus Faecisoma merdavium]|nr:lipopolysaccharide biosynthesis protein [Candidatus Faecisoma merdavium]
MKNENIKNEVISSLIWKFLERIGTQGVQFIVSIILARLLLPSDYGVVSMILVFTAIANVFIQTGFSTSLIQKKDSDELDFSSVFYISLLIAAICYVILFFAAPIIASFYNMPAITSILRVISLTLFFGAINSVQNAKIAKEMKFKKLFLSSLVAILISGTTGVLMAYKGFGPWALVGQQIANSIATTIILWFTSSWQPKLMFSINRVKSLLSYGWKILCSALLDTIYQNIYNLVIGKFYSSSTLGNYNKGEQFPKLIAVNVDGAISSVMLPAYSKQQDRKDKLKKMVRRSIVTSSLLLFPMMFGLAAVAETVVKVLLKENWLGCVPFMQLLCIVYALYPINTANLQVIKALGKSDYFLKLEIIKKVIGLFALIVTLPFGVLQMAIGQVLVAILSTFINAFPNRKLLNYNYFEQIKDLFPSLIISIIMFIIVYSFNFINLNMYILLIIQILGGVIIYFGLAYIFKLESLNYMIEILKSLLNKRRKINE